MNEQAIMHTPNSKYCFAKGINSVSLRLQVARDEKITTAKVVYGCKYSYKDIRKTATMECLYKDRLYDYYVVDIDLDDVRFVYVFEITTPDGTFFFTEDGLSKDYNFDFAFYNHFQLPYINEIDVFKSVDNTENLVAYQIFVDRFRIGKTHKNLSYVNLSVGENPKFNSFGGGDLLGIVEKIEYLKSLGINAIYITPIFESITNHKYDITNYYVVDSHFGENNDLRILVDTAHKYGIKIIMDAVFNHSSDEFGIFEDIKKHGRDSKYYNWFMINGDKPTTNPCNYECFASCTNMPKFNTSNKEVQKYLIDIGLYWLREYKIDGWRLDVSDEVSHDFWKNFRTAIKNENPNCLVIGENWHDAYPFLRGDQFDSIMNYAFTKACLDVFAFNAKDSYSFSNKLNEILMRNTDTVNAMMLNLLDSHDTERFLTQAGENTNKLNAAIATLFFFPGIPCIYYGTENQMTGGYDPDCRKMFDWNKEFEDNSTKNAIRFFANLKENSLLQGAKAFITSENGCTKIVRKSSNKTITLLINIDNDEYILHNQNIIYSSCYENGKINKFGFVVIE